MITSVGLDKLKPGAPLRMTYIDPSGGKIRKALLKVAKNEFTAPTYSYRLDDKRKTAPSESRLVTGRPLLEVVSIDFLSSSKSTVVTAQYSTYHKPKETDDSAKIR